MAWLSSLYEQTLPTLQCIFAPLYVFYTQQQLKNPACVPVLNMKPVEFLFME